MDSVVYTDVKCKKCGGDLFFCYLLDVNRNRHNRIWCPVCVAFPIGSVTKVMAVAYALDSKDLPRYFTKAERSAQMTTTVALSRKERKSGSDEF
jgi:hypothetical protein